MAVTRTARGTATSKTSGTTLAGAAAQALNARDLLVVYLAYDDVSMTSVFWGTQAMTLADSAIGAGVRTRMAWCEADATASRTITATWSAALTAKAFVAESFGSSVTTAGFVWTQEAVAALTGNGTAASTAATAAITGGTESVRVGVVGTEGPSGDVAGTFVEPNTLGQRVGTTGGGAAANVTVSSAYRIAPTAGSTTALSKTGMTSRDWGAVIQSFYWATPPTPDASAYRTAVMALSPLAYYRLHDQSVVPDAGPQGVLQNVGGGALPTTVAGLLAADPNGALDWSDAGQQVLFDRTAIGTSAFDTAFNPAGSFSVALWISPETGAWTSNTRILQIGSDDQHEIMRDAGGPLVFRVRRALDGFEKNAAIPIADVAVGSGTHFITGTYNVSTGTVSIYRNAVLSESVTFATTPYLPRQTATVAAIGNKPNANFGGDQFSGVIDEVAIFGTLLSQAQITDLYNAGTPASGTTVTPGVASLVTTAFAPTVATTNHQTVTPGVAALVSAAFAPTATASNHKTATPGVAVLTTATFAPTASVSNHQTATPGLATLSLTAFAPTATATANVVVTPATASLSTSTFGPTVTATAHQTVTPATASLSTTAFAPTVTATANQGVTPGTASLTLATFAPTATGGAGTTVTPGTASLALSTFAPTVAATASQVATPATAALTTTTFAPTVTAAAGLTLVPGTASLTLATFAPTVTATAHQTVTVGTAVLTLVTFAPTATGGAGLTVVPATASLSTSAFAPTVSTTQHQTVTPAAASLATTSFAPTVATSDHRTYTVGTASLTLATFAPTASVSDPVTVVPSPASLTLTTYIPAVSTAAAFIVGGAPPAGIAVTGASAGSASAGTPQAVAIAAIPSGSAGLGVPGASVSSLNPE